MTRKRITTMTEFDPANHLMKVSGADYLAVKWRLVWLRNDHPNAVIETEMIEHTDTSAIFKATVDIPLEGGTGGGSATGWGSETKGDFKDFLEKAETKALGRALGALGYGTQFSKDYEFGADNGRVVDSPVKPQQRRHEEPQRRGQDVNTVSSLPGPPRQRSVSQNIAPNAPQRPQTNATPDEPLPGLQLATPRQKDFIQALAKELGLTPSALDAESKITFGGTVDELNRRDASIFVERLTKRRAERPTTQAQMIDTTNAAERARS